MECNSEQGNTSKTSLGEKEQCQGPQTSQCVPSCDENYDNVSIFSGTCLNPEKDDEISKSIGGWPSISKDNTMLAVQFYIEMSGERAQDFMADDNKSAYACEKFYNKHFIKFISFYNQDFAPARRLPLNGITMDMFKNAIKNLASDTDGDDRNGHPGPGECDGKREIPTSI